MPTFEWDPAKDETNKAKHGLSFTDASELFAEGIDFLEIYDAEHSDDEERFIAIGPVASTIIVVVYTEPKDDVIRIVSARKATRKEVDRYREQKGGYE